MGRRVVLEQVKSVLLVVLVGVSLVLSARQPMGQAGAGARPPRPYVIEGNLRTAEPAQLLAPRRLILHGGGRHTLLADPGSAAAAALWRSVRNVALAALANNKAAAPAEYREVAALRQAGTGVEAILPTDLPLSDWFAVWSGRDDRAGAALRSLQLRRLALFVQGNGTPVIYLGDGGGWRRLRGSGGADLVAAMRVAAGEGIAAQELTGRWGRLQVEAGIFVPAIDVVMGRLASEREPVVTAADKERLQASFFADSTVVRRIQSQDGTTVATDGRDGLAIYPDGAVAFNRPSSRDKGRDAGKLAALNRAAEFVAGHGGWPGGFRLLAAEAVRSGAAAAATPAGNEAAALLGYRFAFANGFGAYPIVGGLEGPRLPSPAAPGVPAPLEVLTAPSGTVQWFSRAVRRPVFEEREERLMPPQDALTAVDAVLAGFPGRSGAVRDVFPAYLNRRSADGARVLQPAWLVELADGTLAAVDGDTGRVHLAGDAAGVSAEPGGG